MVMMSNRQRWERRMLKEHDAMRKREREAKAEAEALAAEQAESERSLYARARPGTGRSPATPRNEPLAAGAKKHPEEIAAAFADRQKRLEASKRRARLEREARHTSWTAKPSR